MAHHSVRARLHSCGMHAFCGAVSRRGWGGDARMILVASGAGCSGVGWNGPWTSSSPSWRRRVTIALVIASPLAIVLGACSNQGGQHASASGATPNVAAAFPMTVQSCDREITIPRQPKRVVTQGPEAPALVAAAGGANLVVARNAEGGPLGEYAQALQHAPVLPGDTLSREAIVGQRPDLVINRGSGNDLTADDLGQVGIPTVVVSGRCTDNQSGIKADGSFDQIYADIDRFGRIFGTETQAAASVADLRKRVAAFTAQATRTPAGTTAAVVYISGSAVYTYGKLATINTQLATLGLRNIFGDQDKRYIESSLETIIARDPDVLIVLTDVGALTAQQVAALPQLASMRAVREGRVLSLPFGLSIASPLAVDGLQQLAEQLATCGEPPAETTTQQHHRCA
jgi:iron complex transport system substrate-binding protein